jgi:hypothetical protein
LVLGEKLFSHLTISAVRDTMLQTRNTILRFWGMRYPTLENSSHKRQANLELVYLADEDHNEENANNL